MLSSANNKAKIYRPFWLVLFVFIFCITASLLPTGFSLFGIDFKPVDFLSDFTKNSLHKKKKEQIVESKNTISAADSLHYKGVAFENFYPSNKNLLLQFIDKLNALKKKKSKIHIAWFGDSMVEGDLFVQDLRNNLQNEFGGDGVGFVPITSVVGNFRQTIFTQNSGDWKTVSVLKNEQHKLPLGIGGEAFIPQNGSWVSFSAVNKKHLAIFHQAELFLFNPNKVTSIDLLIDDVTTKHIEIPVSSSLQKIDLGIGKYFQHIKISFNADSGFYAYGVNFESENGVFVDNFGVRGSSGIAIGAMQPYSLLNDWKNLHNYDLIILEYGLNVVSPKTNKYDWFQKSFPKAIDKITDNYSESAVLLLSLGDRAVNKNGEYATMEQVPIFIGIQKSISQTEQIAFWNMFDAMGGEGSMANWVNEKPRLANKDYTHINAKGGEVLGQKLFDAILFEVKKRELNL